MSDSYRLRGNAFGYWIIQHPTFDHLAWSGSRWTAIDDSGLPTGDAQVCNFKTVAEADEYAKVLEDLAE